MSPQIGDQAMYRDERGLVFQGTIMDIRPAREWADPPKYRDRGDGYLVAEGEPAPQGKLAFIAVLGWPHMAQVPLDEYVRRDNGIWRGEVPHD